MTEASYDGHTVAITEPFFDNDGNHVPIVHYDVTFTHDYGTGSINFGDYTFPTDTTGINIDAIRRQGHRNPVVTGWIPTSIDSITATSNGILAGPIA